MAFTPVIRDLVIYEGATFDDGYGFASLAEDAPEGTAPTPFDFTGCVARMQVRPSPQSATLYLDIDSASKGGLILDGPAGKVWFNLSPLRTAALFFDTASYDIEIARPGDAHVDRIMQGKITLNRETTR